MEFEYFSIKDVAKPFKQIPGKLKPVGGAIVHAGQTVGGAVGGAAKTVAKGAKLFGGGFVNFFKSLWRWAKWIFWFIVIALFVRYGLPVLRAIGGAVKALLPKKPNAAAA